VFEVGMPPFCGLLCSSPLLYYLENDVYIFVGVY